MVDRRRKEAMYLQLAAAIEGAIREGHYMPGERMPPEREFMRQGNFSYPTVAQAFQEVVKSGLVRRKVGSGTFVADFVPKAPAAERTIGIMYCKQNAFFRPIFHGVEEELRETGYHALALFEGRRQGGEDRVLRHLGSHKTAGLIAVPSLIDSEHRELIRIVTQQFPVVLMDSYLPDMPCDSVSTDNEAAMEAVCDYLFDLGHRRIGFITESVQYPYSTSVRERNAGVKRAFQRAGISDPDRWIVPYGPPDLSVTELRMHIEQAVDTLFEHSTDQPLTAIMCVTDDIAKGVIQVLHGRGLRVPGDISVTGFDGLAWTACLKPSLTTVVQPLDRIGRRAVRLLLERLNTPGRPPTRLILDYHLLVRESTAPPPNC